MYRKKIDLLSIVRPYRYLSLIWVSVVYILSAYQNDRVENLFLVGSLLLLSLVTDYLYQCKDRTQIETLGLVGIEIIGNSILLILSGGIESPFIWYSVNTLLIAGVELGNVYLWMNTFIYLGIGIETSKLNDSLKVMEQLNVIGGLLLISTAIMVILRCTKTVDEQRRKAAQYLAYTMDIYQITYDLTSTTDYKSLMDTLLNCIKDTSKSSKMCISMCYEDTIFIESMGLTPQEIQGLKMQTKLYEEQNTTTKQHIIHYANGLIGVCMQDEDMYYGMLFVEAKDEEELLIFLAYISTITIRKFVMEQISQGTLLKTEQDRIANEIHDSILQKLFGLSCHAFAITKKTEDIKLKQSLDELREGLTDVMTDLRSTIYGLNWTKGETNQFIVKLNRYIDFMEKYYDTQIQLDLQGEIEGLTAAHERMLYRICCEAITNAIRHGKADCVAVHLQKNAEEILLAIKDNGSGFDAVEVSRDVRQGLGLRNMKHLVEGVGGVMAIHSVLKEGTQIHIALPVHNVEEGIE